MTSRITIVVGIAVAAVVGTNSGGWSQDKPEVVGFSVAKKDAGSDYGQSYVPGTDAGLQIYLRVSLPKNTILKVDGDKTSLKVKDSANKELATDDNFMSFKASIGDDKHSAVVPIQCTDFPSAGSTSLTVFGEATLSCGADEKTETVSVTIKEGNELKLGPVTAKVTQIGDGFQPDRKSVELESKVSFDQIESLVFLDATGKEIETSPGASFSSGNISYSQGFQFAGNPSDIAKAKISYFQKIESVKVPVDVKFGMDLGK
jgi:hypothetical protein